MVFTSQNEKHYNASKMTSYQTQFIVQLHQELLRILADCISKNYNSQKKNLVLVKLKF